MRDCDNLDLLKTVIVPGTMANRKKLEYRYNDKDGGSR
jgi:hypothetical protein